MFDKKTVDAYKQITAPDELKEKVMAACFVDKAPEKRNFFGTMRMYATLAACFVLVIVFSVFAVGNFGDLSVSVYGKTLTFEPMVLSNSEIEPIAYSAEPRALCRTSVPVEIEVSGETEISVSDGMMKVCAAETEEELYSGTEFTAEENVLIYWTVDADEAATHFEMAINGRKKSYVLLLDFDENTKQWAICREKQKN